MIIYLLILSLEGHMIRGKITVGHYASRYSCEVSKKAIADVLVDPAAIKSYNCVKSKLE